MFRLSGVQKKRIIVKRNSLFMEHLDKYVHYALLFYHKKETNEN